MAEKKISNLPISEIHSEEGAQDLVRSEKMKPYLALLKAQMSGQDTEPYLAALAALPLEERYVWRVVSALKWAFCDLDTETAMADLHTLSEADLKKVVEPLSLRAIQFCMFVNALLGDEATERIMLHALRCAKESSAPDSGE
ncbi:MAG: hypothetical protein ABR905_21700 [Terracidiphilus sp.]